MIRNNRFRKAMLVCFTVVFTLGFVGLTAIPVGGTTTTQFSGNMLEEQPDMPDEQIQKITDSSSTFSFEGTDFLVKDAYPEINQLITDYYDAVLRFDIDMLDTLVSDITRVDQNLIRAKLEYMESITNIICYTVEGPLEGTFRVYVYYDLKIRGIETLAPALSAMYVTMSSDGSYVIYLSEIDEETQEFIETADASGDVQLLSSLVSERLNNVINSDAAMRDFYTMMEAAVNPATTEVPAEGTEAVPTDVPTDGAATVPTDVPADGTVPAPAENPTEVPVDPTAPTAVPVQ